MKMFASARIFSSFVVPVTGMAVNRMNDKMDRTSLLEIIRKLLKTNDNLDFLLTLPGKDLKTLIGCIRERLDQMGK